jgi:hypothetical protein
MAAALRTPTAVRLLTTARRRRPPPHTFLAYPAPAVQPPLEPLRELHASAARRAAGDGSTIDFAFLPAMEYLPREERAAWMRIPVEPDATGAAPEVAVDGAGGFRAAERAPVDEPVRTYPPSLFWADLADAGTGADAAARDQSPLCGWHAHQHAVGDERGA